MNNIRTQYTFLWFIENYSYCWHKNGEVLVSPEFTAEGLKGTVWTMQLYPRGHDDECKGYISLYLKRKDVVDDCPEEFPLTFVINILATDRAGLRSRYCGHAFQRGKGHGAPKFQEMDEVLVRRKDDYLPQDILSICCKIWRGEGTIQQVIQITARTRIGVEHISFFHVTENFSKLEPNEKKTIHIENPSRTNCTLRSSLHFIEDSDEKKIIMEITPSDMVQTLCKCRLHLLSASGKEIECGEMDTRFDAERKDVQNLFLTLTRQEILNGKSEYLRDDILFLSCECVFSTEVEYSKIKKIQYMKPFVASKQINNYVQSKNIFNTAHKLSVCPSALDDLKSIYSNQFLTDVNLKTKTKSFPAHKILLCARSPVFKAMLTTDMKEKNSNSIQVEDLEDNIVQQLLLFMYTDKLEDLQWESAIKLYYAGDKYEIEKLKIICSSFLADNITPSFASELLVLSDAHNDSDLKKFVEDFILKHEEKVFGSKEWEKLSDVNAQLVSKTMLLKYKREE